MSGDPEDNKTHHIVRQDWLRTTQGDPRGYIQPESLGELWFHTGTKCNLRCPFCFEGSAPDATRLDDMGLDDIRPFIDEAVRLGVEQFSFTGGEPLMNKDIINILRYALQRRPCLVLTNGTKPLRNRLDDLLSLRELPNALKSRISLDSHDSEIHDRGRGAGQFQLALESLLILHEYGFEVSIARLSMPDEDSAEVERAFRDLITRRGLPTETNVIVFPDLHPPCATVKTPEITENCMTTYKDETTRRQFMCSYSKMVLKKNGQARVYACTLVDDNPDYDLGGTLTEAMRVRVMLRHHRCYSCFSSGVSCSEAG